MSRPSRSCAVLYNTEASWADQSVSTFGTRLNATNEVDVSKLTWTKFEPSRVVQFRNELTPLANGYLGGEIETEFAITGLGSTAASTIALNALMTLLGLVIGNAVAGRTGPLTATAAGTATALNVSVATGTLAGALVRVGALNDGRGNGQWSQAITHATSVLTLLAAIDAAPAAADVIYNPCNIYPSESPVSNDITSVRFRFLTANQQYECRGCYPKKVTFTGLATGSEPKVRITWGVSIWAEVSTTYPVSTAVDTFPTCAIAAGSFFFGPYGTATRTLGTSKFNTIRDFTLTYDLGVVATNGPGGTNPNQMCTGAKRTQDKISISFVDDSEATTTTPLWRTRSAQNVPWHLMYSAAAVDGSSFGIRAPWVVFDKDMPTQANVDGLNRVKVNVLCGTDNTRATDLERAALVIGIA